MRSARLIRRLKNVDEVNEIYEVDKVSEVIKTTRVTRSTRPTGSAKSSLRFTSLKHVGKVDEVDEFLGRSHRNCHGSFVLSIMDCVMFGPEPSVRPMSCIQLFGVPLSKLTFSNERRQSVTVL